MTPDQRIDDLENRLDRYHEWLVESIQQRDRLALDAAWGVHYALYSNLAVAALAAGYYIAFDQRSWGAFGVIFVVGLLVSQFAIHAWSNRARMKEVDRLAKLPDWEWKHS